MEYNLTDREKNIARWLVKNKRAGYLPEEFQIMFSRGLGADPTYDLHSSFEDEREKMQKIEDLPQITKNALKQLDDERLIRYEIESLHNVKRHVISLLERIYGAVDSNFLNISVTGASDDNTIAGFNINVVRFKHILVKHFNVEELTSVTYNAAIPADNLKKDTREIFAQEIIEYARRHGTILQLLIEAIRHNKAANWHILY